MTMILDGTAGVTFPAGGTQSSGNSGMIAFFAMNTPPSGWLVADGSAVSRTTYADLFAALVTSAGFTSQTFTVTIASPAVFTRNAHGFTGGERIRLSTTGALPTGLNTTTDYFVIFVNANTFRVSTTFGGSAVNTSGSQSGTHSYLQSWYGLGDGSTTFNLPNLGGQFVRGWVSGQSVDSGRGFGTQQADAFESHTHGPTDNSFVTQSNTAGNFLTGGGAFQYALRTTTAATGGTETRPVNFAMLACIKT